MSTATMVSQSTLFDSATTSPLNVARVRQVSPFRYPGGKTWFVPYARQWLLSLGYEVDELIEPFAGGASVALNMLFDGLVRHITLVEMDSDVISVWKTIFEGDANDLAQSILTFEMTPENVQQLLSRKPTSMGERAFQTIVRNRVNRGGILAPGAGMLRNGENGKGLLSRWYPKTISDRILKLSSLSAKVSVIEGDGILALESRLSESKLAAFIDPPYTIGSKSAGKRLYAFHELNHRKLFQVASRFTGPILMTYPDELEVKTLALQYKFKTARIAMKTTHHNVQNELVVGRDMSFLERHI